MLHDKYHNKNHHTTRAATSNIPDSGLDSIASPEDPFQGDFVLKGTFNITKAISDQSAVNITSDTIGMIISAANISVTAHGTAVLEGSVNIGKIILTQAIITLPKHEANTTNEFLRLSQGESSKYLRLLKLSTADIPPL